MWLFSTDGFLSIAQKDPATPDVLVVRSRARADLERFVERIPTRKMDEIVEGKGTDYPYRIAVTRVEVASTLALMIDEVGYPNFKNALTARLGERYHAVASRIWTALLALEPPFWQRRFGPPSTAPLIHTPLDDVPPARRRPGPHGRSAKKRR